MKAEIKVVCDPPPSCIVRVGDLEIGACFSKEYRVWVKQENGYCIALDNLVRYQVRPLEQVEQIFTSVVIVVSK